jgi:hypothetical protein
MYKCPLPYFSQRFQSPQSNGMAEAFVKTIKRDYARVSARPDAASVLRQLDSWFEHYNTVHPYKALGYRSPHEFRKHIAEKTPENAVGAPRPFAWTKPAKDSLAKIERLPVPSL